MEHVAVGLEVRAAPGGVDHDGKIVARERVDVGSSELACLLAVAGMSVQCPAADLPGRRRHPPPVALEDPHRRALRLAEGLPHDAAGEQRHVRVGALRQHERPAFRARRERAQPFDAARADASRQRREPAAHDEVGQPRRDGEPATARDGIEADAPDGARDPALRAALREHLSRALHDPAERNARRARGLARATDEARIEMSAERRGRRGGRRHEIADELDAPARRVRLLTEDAVRRAIVEAQPARDARGEILGADMRGERSDSP